MATTPNRGYQLPAPPAKLKDDVLKLIAALGAIDADVAALLLAMADKSDVGHGHAMGAITGLVAALASKIDVGYHDALSGLTDVDVAGAANGMALMRQASKWIPVALQINNIVGLETALNGKATPADIAIAIDALVGSAPGALDTLNELAAALGDDPNFAATVTTALGQRVLKSAVASEIATAIDAAISKALPIDADLVGFRDSVSGALRKMTFGNLRVWALQYFARFDAAQALTQAQKGQALQNIGGAWEQIGGVVTLSVNTAIQLWTGLSGYRELRLKGYTGPTASGIIVAQVGDGNGTTWHNAAGNYANQTGWDNGNTVAAAYTAAAQFSVSAGRVNAGRFGEFDLELGNFNGASVCPMAAKGAYRSDPSDVMISGRTGGYSSNPTARDSLRIFSDAGSLLAGSRFILEGIRS